MLVACKAVPDDACFNRLEVTGLARLDDNAREIDCTNLWLNRLVGDSNLQPEKRLTQANIPFKPATALLPSGLLGPVCVLRN